jgi:GNAT superfamily N-acetyltransferase
MRNAKNGSAKRSAHDPNAQAYGIAGGFVQMPCPARHLGLGTFADNDRRAIMLQPTFEDYRPEDQAILRAMIHALYADDSKGGDVHATSDEHIQRTIERARTHPDQLRIVLFKVEGAVAGYSLLTNYWSNEHGGLVLILDEVFVLPEFRGKGISSRFFEHLFAMPEYVMVYLEVFPGNTVAYELYKRMGFQQFERSYMYRMQSPIEG